MSHFTKPLENSELKYLSDQKLKEHMNNPSFMKNPSPMNETLSKQTENTRVYNHPHKDSGFNLESKDSKNFTVLKQPQHSFQKES